MISQEEVQYISHLARIYIDAEKINRFTKDLEDILHYIGKLEKLDVSQIPPTSHVLSLKNVYRQDVIKPSLNQQEALAIAITQQNNSFKVPLIIE